MIRRKYLIVMSVDSVEPTGLSATRMEETLRKLVSAIKPSVPAQELQEASEKIEHDEFGIVLQVIGAVIVDHHVRLAPKEKQQMIALIEGMGMTNQDDENYWFGRKCHHACSPAAGWA